MKITLITLIYNEEKRLPFFLRHYNKFVDKIIAYLNVASKDKSEILLRNNPNTEVIYYDTDGYLSEEENLKIKNTSWKNLDSDWFIVCDADEYLYLNGNIRDLLKEYLDHNINFPMIEGYQMIGEPCPMDDGKSQIYDFNKIGTRHYTADKQIIFGQGLNIQFDFGGHYYKIMNDASVWKSPLKLLHYRYFSYEETMNYYKNVNVNPNDKRTLGFINPKVISDHYNDLFSRRIKVI